MITLSTVGLSVFTFVSACIMYVHFWYLVYDNCYCMCTCVHSWNFCLVILIVCAQLVYGVHVTSIAELVSSNFPSLCHSIVIGMCAGGLDTQAMFIQGVSE